MNRLNAAVFQRGNGDGWDVDADGPKEAQKRNAVEAADGDVTVLDFRMVVKFPGPILRVLNLRCVRKLLLNDELRDLLINSEALIALDNAFHYFFAFR